MLKIRLYAALIALVCTLITLYFAPRIFFAYSHWESGLSLDQRGWFNAAQILLVVMLAGFGFWQWKNRGEK